MLATTEAQAVVMGRKIVNEMISVRNLPLIASVTAQVAPSALIIDVVVAVRDRESGGPFNLTRRAIISGLTILDSPLPAIMLANEIRKLLCDALAHEVGECLLLEGRRVFEPHLETPPSVVGAPTVAGNG